MKRSLQSEIGEEVLHRFRTTHGTAPGPEYGRPHRCARHSGMCVPRIPSVPIAQYSTFAVTNSLRPAGLSSQQSLIDAVFGSGNAVFGSGNDERGVLFDI